MALFGKKKDEANVPQGTPVSGAAPGSAPADNSFDFNAISRDLDAQNGASSFDSLLAQPVNPPTAQSGVSSSNSGFEIPENDPLGLGTGTPSVPLGSVAGSTVPLASSPDAVINAPLSPNVGAPTPGVAPPNVVAPVAPNAAALPKTKKPLPLIPVLGGAGIIVVAIGSQMFLISTAPPHDEVPHKTPPARLRRSSDTGGARSGGGGGGGNRRRRRFSPPAGAPPASSGGAPVAPPTRNVSPGIPPAGTTPNSSPGVSIQVPPGGAPATLGGIDPAMALRLKAFWQAGADAKHRKDYTGARKAWGEALRLSPNHPGFQEAINKLPR